MSDFRKLEELVKALYEEKLESRDGWADWLYTNHVLWVADKAEELAQRYNVDPGLCRSAALLHDVSDAKIAREDPTSEALSLQIAEELLNQAGFDQRTIRLLVDDALRYHSCRDGKKPKSDVGKVLATADATAHFQTDFYPYAFSAKLFSDYEKTKNWAAGKIDKDYKNKIFFEDIKAEVLPQYETLKMVFGEL